MNHPKQGALVHFINQESRVNILCWFRGQNIHLHRDPSATSASFCIAQRCIQDGCVTKTSVLWFVQFLLKHPPRPKPPLALSANPPPTHQRPYGRTYEQQQHKTKKHRTSAVTRVPAVPWFPQPSPSPYARSPLRRPRAPWSSRRVAKLGIAAKDITPQLTCDPRSQARPPGRGRSKATESGSAELNGEQKAKPFQWYLESREKQFVGELVARVLNQ